MKVLLDTNAYSALLAGQASVARYVRSSQRVFISVIVIGELMFGFRKGSRFQQNMKEFEEFAENPFVELLPVTLTTADRFSRIAVQLKRKGTPIPTNDMWIAAQALEVGADLMSFDRHFKAIEGLALLIPE